MIGFGVAFAFQIPFVWNKTRRTVVTVPGKAGAPAIEIFVKCAPELLKVVLPLVFSFFGFKEIGGAG